MAKPDYMTKKNLVKGRKPPQFDRYQVEIVDTDTGATKIVEFIEVQELAFSLRDMNICPALMKHGRAYCDGLKFTIIDKEKNA